jgi:hypothetical protein
MAFFTTGFTRCAIGQALLTERVEVRGNRRVFSVDLDLLFPCRDAPMSWSCDAPLRRTRELHRRGPTVEGIAMALGVSRQTAFRYPAGARAS